MQLKRETKLLTVIGLTTMHAVCRITFMLYPVLSVYFYFLFYFILFIYFCLFSSDSLTVSSGQVVHPECRRLYCHPNQERDGPKKETEKIILSPKTRASIENKFSFQTKCLFCGTAAKFYKRKRGVDVFEVRTLKFQESVREKCLRETMSGGKQY